jgi:DNA polymerase-3 subunit epsilon
MTAAARFVVFDQETTGLDPAKDRIVSIGAVAVVDGEIVLGDFFEEMLRVDEVTSAVLVHGITPEQSRNGRDEGGAVTAFLAYIGGAVLVGHHVGFDHAILRAAAARLGLTVPNPALDTMRLALALKDEGHLTLDPEAGFSLDGLCEHFRIPPHDRHTAPGDAFLTAQVFARLLRIAIRHDLDVMTFCENP